MSARGRSKLWKKMCQCATCGHLLQETCKALKCRCCRVPKIKAHCLPVWSWKAEKPKPQQKDGKPCADVV
jgi:hypothetical protein